MIAYTTPLLLSLLCCKHYTNAYSVINSGKSLAQYLQHIQSLVTAAAGTLDHLQVHVIAGVMQSEAALNISVLAQQRCIANTAVTYHVLRVSDNKYTGKGGTDTGNRLFNTTNLR
jgi:Uracil phosphoribosyltransferase